jgi:hypothetical protein
LRKTELAGGPRFLAKRSLSSYFLLAEKWWQIRVQNRLQLRQSALFTIKNEKEYSAENR